MFSFLVFALVVGNRDGADQNLPATRKEDLTAERKGSFEKNRVSKSSLSQTTKPDYGGNSGSAKTTDTEENVRDNYRKQQIGKKIMDELASRNVSGRGEAKAGRGEYLQKGELYHAQHEVDWEDIVKDDPNEVDEKGRSLIMLASVAGKSEIVRDALKRKADVNQRDFQGRTALSLAAMYGHVEILRILISHKAKLNNIDAYKRTPLVIAVWRNRTEVVRELLAHGHDYKPFLDTKGALFAASWAAWEPIVKLLVERRKRGAGPQHAWGSVDIEEEDPDGWTALLVSCAGNPEDYAAGENFERWKVHTNPRLGITKLLLEHGANPNHATKSGQTALIGASAQGFRFSVKALLEHKADVNKADAAGMTPLIKASFGGFMNVARLLLEHNAKVNLADAEGTTALIGATMGGNDDVVKLLLEHKANVNQKDGQGRTALHIAAEEMRRTRIVRLLLDHKADVDLEDMMGKKARDIADDDAVKRLLDEHKSSGQRAKQTSLDQNADFVEQLLEPERPSAETAPLVGAIRPAADPLVVRRVRPPHRR